ncbi:Uncharacterized protein dnm_078180 [Desulfonema magnum]|uniref:Uncharacterized protein n=1 Tax=Desulfonema magnum TaxID=45655 RepID=A0A975BU27_9BACT|nr:Uncharacterized protein dnm_078180 [Desulfonema magnum]
MLKVIKYLFSADRKVSGGCAGLQKNPAFFLGTGRSPRPEKPGFLPCPPCDSLKIFRSANSEFCLWQYIVRQPNKKGVPNFQFGKACL